MVWVILIGRVLFGLIFVGSAFGGHFAQNKETAQYAEMRGIPNASIMVYLTGVWIALAGFGMILGIWTDLAALMIVIWCLGSAVLVHHFWTDEGMMRTIEMTNFMKNLSMGGAGLALFVFFAWAGDAVGLQIVGPAFEIMNL
jgi:uncharacterized membrane protein YphA (DoxX/SURF4 family)